MPAVTPDIDDRLFAEVEAGQRVLLAYENHPGTGEFEVLEDPHEAVLLRGVDSGTEIVVETDTGRAFKHSDGREGFLGVVTATVPVHSVATEMACRRCSGAVEWYVTEQRDDGSEQSICTDCAGDALEVEA